MPLDARPDAPANDPADAGAAARADRSYWRANGLGVALFTALWLLVTLAPALWATSEITVWGLALPVWIAAQAAPVAYVLIVWAYQWRMDRLDREHRAPPNA